MCQARLASPLMFPSELSHGQQHWGGVLCMAMVLRASLSQEAFTSFLGEHQMGNGWQHSHESFIHSVLFS